MLGHPVPGLQSWSTCMNFPTLLTFSWIVLVLFEPLGEDSAELVEGPDGELLLDHGRHLLLQPLQLTKLHEVRLGQLKRA